MTLREEAAWHDADADDMRDVDVCVCVCGKLRTISVVLSFPCGDWCRLATSAYKHMRCDVLQNYDLSFGDRVHTSYFG